MKGTFLSVYLILLGLVSSQVSASTKGINVAEFNSLCEIYRIAKAGFQIKPEDYTTEHFIEKNMTEILSHLNIMENQANISDGAKGASEPRAYTSLELGGRKAFRDREVATFLKWKKKIEGISDYVHKILLGVNQSLGGMPQRFSRLALGNDLRDLTKPTVDQATARTNTCKYSTAQKPGKTLVVDFLCLCAGTSGQAVQPCGFVAAGSGGSSYWNPTQAIDEGNNDGATNTVSTWKKIEEKCPSREAAAPPTAAEIRRAIDGFNARLGNKAGSVVTTANSGGPGFILGTPDAAASCTGAGSHHACVHYGDQGTPTKAIIGWRDKLVGIAVDLDGVEKKLQLAQRLVEQARRYEELVEEALAAIQDSEHFIQGPLTHQHTNLQQADKKGQQGEGVNKVRSEERAKNFKARFAVLLLSVPLFYSSFV